MSHGQVIAQGFPPIPHYRPMSASVSCLTDASVFHFHSSLRIYLDAVNHPNHPSMIHRTYFSRAQISHSLNRSITNTLQTFSPFRFFALCFVSFWYPWIRFRETPLVDDSRPARRADSFLSWILTCEFPLAPLLLRLFCEVFDSN